MRARFGESLSAEELSDFIELARSQRLLDEQVELDDTTPAPRHWSDGSTTSDPQSILNWHRAIYDPDCLFDWIEPRLRFFWTRSFVLLSSMSIAIALWILWLNRLEAAQSIAGTLSVRSALLFWITMFSVTTLHEFAHGLTCKHFGGDVHELGFLLLFFVPCFYCNVSDAWLFRDKAKRLFVTFAGGYFELFLWSLAVFLWRLSHPDCLIHSIAFIVLSACGVQVLFNWNPLLKLDGYYLLCDWLEVPNLYQRSLDHFKASLRWLLWGSTRHIEARGRLLWTFGICSWLFSVVFVWMTLGAIAEFVARRYGVWCGAGAFMIGLFVTRGMFAGLCAGECMAMLRKRPIRLLGWLAGLAGGVGLLSFVEVEDRVGGPFRIEPENRAEVRAPVSGFIESVCCEEGDVVSAGCEMVRLVVPDLESRAARNAAELRGAQAKLRLLQMGIRSEEVMEQKQRIARARAWRDRAREDLAQSSSALAEELSRLDKQIEQWEVEFDATQKAYMRTKSLLDRRAASEEQFSEAERKQRIAQAQLEQARAERRAREARGNLAAESELERREMELAEAESALSLMESGSRPEEIQGQEARLEVLQEEARYLNQVRQKLLVHCPASGIVITTRMQEKTGHYLREGDLICRVEEVSKLQAEIQLAEENAARLQIGHLVTLKVRALPFDTFRVRVDRIAPQATDGGLRSSVTVYAQLENAAPELRSGMTGYARIYTGSRSIGSILLDRMLRLIRTEFWW
jgi:multidrug efflux pump subunit AcrA (membrane-fusion protein)